MALWFGTTRKEKRNRKKIGVIGSTVNLVVRQIVIMNQVVRVIVTRDIATFY
ncbi:hypothetical protein J2Z48_000929 [Croceifilum oryzae]|uniref:Uncharacterized protein n=1 Tax=Croceifilum oryzae TaxID=1553429 RepID=A0AAJ1THR4_9BACL|nr:hypothetical protein [Croceifilum oryzae]MDQ0416762.1 hypothetical protein [Croceifilum oryzae]